MSAGRDELTADRLREALGLLAGLLDGSAASYAVIGGLAASYHGVPRLTRDIDLLFSVARVSLPGLLARLHSAGFSLDPERVVKELSQDHMSAIDFHGVRVDLLEPVIPLFEQYLRESLEVDALGTHWLSRGSAGDDRASFLDQLERSRGS